MDKVRLNVLGISYNPVQNGAFALLLAEQDGPMRIPVIIGTPEAQSIAIRLEGVIPQRPLTHDLFATMMRSFGLRLLEVFIYKFEDGIFSSEMLLSDGEREVTIDARTSDAVAIAMRVKAPIFTTRSIVEETGIRIADSSLNDEQPDDNTGTTTATSQAETIEDLEKRLAQLINDEDYEEAARLSTRLNAMRNRAAGDPLTSRDDNPGDDPDDNLDDDAPSISDLLK